MLLCQNNKQETDVIEYTHVYKSYPNGDVVLDDINFTAVPGDFVIITGKSGAGKTTIGRMLLKDINPTEGTIVVDGQDLSQIKNKELPKYRRNIGFVFQDFKIVSDKNVYENIETALAIAGFEKDKIDERIKELLSLVDLSNKGELFPNQLAGGELQRVAIARAVAAKPAILFADEPTGNLDRDTSIEIFKLLKKINESGTTIIVCTHDITLINLNTARHIHLKNGKITDIHLHKVEETSSSKSSRPELKTPSVTKKKSKTTKSKTKNK